MIDPRNPKTYAHLTPEEVKWLFRPPTGPLNDPAYKTSVCIGCHKPFSKANPRQDNPFSNMCGPCRFNGMELMEAFIRAKNL